MHPSISTCLHTRGVLLRFGRGIDLASAVVMHVQRLLSRPFWGASRCIGQEMPLQNNGQVVIVPTAEAEISGLCWVTAGVI